MDFSSRRCFAVVLGYDIFSPLSVSRTIWETTNRACSLSSAGTTYQGVWWVLVASKQAFRFVDSAGQLELPIPRSVALY